MPRRESTKIDMEFMCQLFMKSPEGGSELPMTGGGMVSGSREEVEKHGKDSLGKMARFWDGKESKRKCIGYKIWQRIS